MTYDELRAALTAYAHRTDPETIANEPTALELARSRLGRHFFPELALAIEPALVPVAGVADLPATFGQADTVATAHGDLAYQTPREWARAVARRDTDGKFTIAGTKLYVDPSIASVALTYYRQPEVIAAGASNWLSLSFPDVWLWEAVAEQHRFCQDGESAALAQGEASRLAAEAELETRGNKEGGALRMTSRR